MNEREVVVVGEAVRQLNEDAEFGRTIGALIERLPDADVGSVVGDRVVRYLLARRVEYEVAMVISLAYSSGWLHGVAYVGTAIGRSLRRRP